MSNQSRMPLSSCSVFGAHTIHNTCRQLVQCIWFVAAATGSPGMSEARFVVEAACIRLDGKHHYGFQQRNAEVCVTADYRRG